MEQQSPSGSPAVARGLNAVHVVPADWSAAPAALASAIDRVDADMAGTQLLVIVADVESAVGVTQALLRTRGGAPPRVIAATGSDRIARLLRAGSAPILVGSSEQLLALVRASALKLDSVRTVVVAWVDEILAGGPGEDFEALLAGVPKDAGRVILTARLDTMVEDFIERHARRAPRLGIPTAGEGAASREDTGAAMATEAGVSTTAEVSYVTVAQSARPTTLRRVLDEVDPPSAAVWVRTDTSEQQGRDLLRTLGYDDANATVHLVLGAAVNHVAVLILYDLPHNLTEWNAATACTPARIVALVRPQQLPQLRALTSATLKPLAFTAPIDAARAQDAALRAALRRELGAGAPARELLMLEPLLAEFDGVTLAAAAVRMLERERLAHARAAAAAATERLQAAPAQQHTRIAPPGRDERPRHDRPHHDRPHHDRPHHDRPRADRSHHDSTGDERGRGGRPGSARGEGRPPTGRSGSRDFQPRERGGGDSRRPPGAGGRHSRPGAPRDRSGPRNAR